MYSEKILEADTEHTDSFDTPCQHIPGQIYPKSKFFPMKKEKKTNFLYFPVQDLFNMLNFKQIKAM